jgi:hypothetical protein
MGLEILPAVIQETWECHEWRHACAVMVKDFPNEWEDLIGLLNSFKLRRSELTAEGKGNKSLMATQIDSFLFKRGWNETKLIRQLKLIRQKDLLQPIKLIALKMALHLKLNGIIKTHSLIATLIISVSYSTFA